MKRHASKNKVSQAILIGIFGLFITPGFSQGFTVVTPVSKQIFKMPDVGALQTAATTQAASTTVDAAGKALLADAASEKTVVAVEQNNYSQAETQKNDYLAAINGFSKNDVEPYKVDLNNYNTEGAKFLQLLTKHNNAVKANNALPPKARTAANVGMLNKEKLQVDSNAAVLGKWKARLDIAKGKLDAKNAALQKQQQKYTAAEQSAVNKLKGSRTRLTAILNQLTACAAYAGKCKALLKNKFYLGSISAPGIFETAEYKNTFSYLNAQLAQLRSL